MNRSARHDVVYDARERLCFEPGAVMFHWEASRARHVARILFRQGRGMGHVRQGGAGLAGKAWASALVPAMALHRAPGFHALH